MPARKFRWDESSSGDSAGEWRYMLPRKKRARKSEAATAQDSRDTSKTGVKGSDRRRTYLEVIMNTQRDSESEQQNDVDMNGAGAGASGAAAASGASAGTVSGEKKRAQEEDKKRMVRIQAALAKLGSGDDMKEVRDKLNQEMSRAKKASEPQQFANDIEGKAAWVSREARRLNELEAEIAKLQAHLIQKRRELQVEIQELDVLRAQLAKNTGCVGAGDQGNGHPCRSWKNVSYLFFGNWWRRMCRQIWKLLAWMGQNAREKGMSCVRFRSPLPTRNNVWLLLKVACDKAEIWKEGEMVPSSPSRVGTLQA